MKIEIEVKEDDIREAMISMVRDVIFEKARDYWVKKEIKTKVDSLWSDAIDALIIEQLNSIEEIKENIAIEVERKLKAQINKLMQEKNK